MSGRSEAARTEPSASITRRSSSQFAGYVEKSWLKAKWMTPSDRAAPSLRLSRSSIDPRQTSAPAAARAPARRSTTGKAWRGSCWARSAWTRPAREPRRRSSPWSRNSPGSAPRIQSDVARQRCSRRPRRRRQAHTTSGSRTDRLRIFGLRGRCANGSQHGGLQSGDARGRRTDQVIASRPHASWSAASPDPRAYRGSRSPRAHPARVCARNSSNTPFVIASRMPCISCW